MIHAARIITLDQTSATLQLIQRDNIHAILGEDTDIENGKQVDLRVKSLSELWECRLYE
jgi:hypothetical protein